MDKVVHFEIPADDLERAQKFYHQIFGWKIEKYPMPAGSEYPGEYYGIHTVEVDDRHKPKEAGAINGGMVKRRANVGSPVITIEVDDIDQRAKEIEKHGGKMLSPKTNIGGMGFVAYFKDTEENSISLWQNAEQ